MSSVNSSTFGGAVTASMKKKIPPQNTQALKLMCPSTNHRATQPIFPVRLPNQKQKHIKKIKIQHVRKKKQKGGYELIGTRIFEAEIMHQIQLLNIDSRKGKSVLCSFSLAVRKKCAQDAKTSQPSGLHANITVQLQLISSTASFSLLLLLVTGYSQWKWS